MGIRKITKSYHELTKQNRTQINEYRKGYSKMSINDLIQLKAVNDIEIIAINEVIIEKDFINNQK